MINKRLLKLIGEDRKYIGGAVMWKWFTLLLNILFVLGIGYTLNQYLIQNNIVLPIISLVIIVILKNITSKKAIMASYYVSENIKYTLRTELYRKLLLIGPSYKNYISPQTLTQIAGEGIEQLEVYFGRFLPQLFYSLLAPITLFVVLSFYSIKVGLVLLLCVPLIPISIIIVQKIAKRIIGKYLDNFTQLGDTFLESLQGLTTLKIFLAEKQKQQQLIKESEVFRKQTMRVLYMQLNSIIVMDFVAYGGAALGIVVMLQGYFNNTISLISGFIIILLTADFFIPLRELGSFFHVALNGISASKKLMEILDIEVKPVTVIDTPIKHIAITNLNYSYDEQPFIKDVSLKLDKGLYGLVGVSGSGKSTIANIFNGVLEINDNSIDINGNKVNTYDLSKRLSTIRYNAYIFQGTLRDNLTMGANIDEDTLWHMIEEFGLDDTFNSLDDTITEEGSNLSGGQKQRIALIRCLLHKKDVYIFDEATTSLDALNESNIMKYIYELSKDSIVLIITHRLENIKDSKKIYVMNKGKIYEEGNHNELMNQQGYYYNMYTTQQQQMEVK